MKFKFLGVLFCLTLTVSAQQINTGMTDRSDTTDMGKVRIQGYVDVYYGYDFNQPTSNDRAYAVSSPRHNEININLAYIDLSYNSKQVRARFIPGVGTYINSNYASETGSLKSIIEANAGLCLSQTKGIWVDAGVMGSPFTNESAISKDHFLYTRSFASEYSPYYLSGVRVTVPLSKKVIGYFYVVNGWQEISDINNPLSFASQIEFHASKKLLLNWNTYAGNESSKVSPHFQNRYFSDLYAIYNLSGKFSLTADAYIGKQVYKDTIQQGLKSSNWGQANVCVRYKITPKHALAGRLEYYQDLKEIIVSPITPSNGFSSASATLGYTIQVSDHGLFRIEGRHFFSDKQVYIDENGNNSKTDNLLITNITVWF